MTNRIIQAIIDSDAIFALTLTSDANHHRAIRIKKDHPDCRYFLSHFVIGEAATVLSRKMDKATADGFLQGLPEQRFHVVPVDKKVMALAEMFFLRQITKNTSFVDCVNMATAKRLGIDTVFSFDRVYERNGFTLLSADS
ncbi:PIN domain-containing protein [Candidatus Gottesmanbacteria bacterium]|nr:PIN domain-containing protein [Candidatus Gottesmanbacteria bacterium]